MAAEQYVRIGFIKYTATLRPASEYCWPAQEAHCSSDQIAFDDSERCPI
jgi:hypothetical protein